MFVRWRFNKNAKSLRCKQMTLHHSFFLCCWSRKQIKQIRDYCWFAITYLWRDILFVTLFSTIDRPLQTNVWIMHQGYLVLMWGQFMFLTHWSLFTLHIISGKNTGTKTVKIKNTLLSSVLDSFVLKFTLCLIIYSISNSTSFC